MQQLLDLKKAEQEARLKEKMDRAGLNFEDHELPPDEIDEKEVSKGAWYTLKSMVPFTDAYYEASAAEDEMDNLRKIRIEKAKASDLLALTKNGRHEEALAKMMSETNNDFFFFNKLRTKMEQEGKLAPETIKGPTVKTRNRIKKAHGKRFEMISAAETEALTAMTRPVENEKKRPREDAPCTWRGKDKEGGYLTCANLRMRHPTKKVTVGGKEVPDILLFCPYHIPNCTSDTHSSDVRITQCNEKAFCMECYITLGKGKPMVFNKENTPGVAPVQYNKTKVEFVPEVVPDDHASLNENTVCRWKPTGKERELRDYRCTNKIIRNPDTNQWIPFCGYHVHVCIKAHAGGAAAVTEPNEHGLCASHYVSQLGHAPPELRPPFPGMINVGEKNRRARTHVFTHWAAPRVRMNNCNIRVFFP